MKTQRMRRVAVVAIVFLTASVPVYFAWHWRGTDGSEHSNVVSAILELQRANEQLARSLGSWCTEPANLTKRVEHSLAAVRKAVQRVESESQRNEISTVMTGMKDYSASFGSAALHVGPFIEACAAWDAGLQLIPDDILRMEQAGRVDSETQRALHEVVTQLSLLQVSVEAEPTAQMSTALEFLRSKARSSSKSAESTAAFVRNCDRLVEDKKRLETELAAITDLELTRSVAELLELYERAFDDGLSRAEYFRLGVYVLTVGLLGRLVQIMLELKKRTREFDEANRTLEERVDERTLKLSAANLALKVEIVERERAEIKSQNALAQAEAASRAKSEFLANTSHEIRTPMTSILGFSERLLDPGLSDGDKLEALSRIRRNGEHLLQIINDILDISKIEAGMLAVERISSSPHQILAEVHGAMDVRAAISGIDLRVESIGGVPETIVTDPVRLKQVLINLVGNAIKFTERGWVRLVVTLEGGEAPRLRFAVMDTGIGMDEETVSRLFRPFMQADSSTTRRFGGTGLGLSICKHLVERLGGTLDVTSRVGHGSVFTFSIETGPISGVKMLRGQSLSFLAELSHEDLRLTAPRLSGARILVVEDGEDNRRLIGFVLSTADAHVEVAVDGSDALSKVKAAEESGRPFHMILMDMQMPVMDGYEAARRLRAAGCTSAIVALTAHAMSNDREKCLEAGCDDFCTKPIVRHVFLATIAKWIEKIGGPLPLAPARVHDESQDDAEFLELVQMFVADLDADVVEMRAAFSAGDLEKLSEVAHRLKGAAGSYGFPSLTTHAGVLEKHAKAGAPHVELERDLELVAGLCTAAFAAKGAK